ncbi:hypothetical protein HWV07_06635 [Natronomonas salina]|uniref:hypothetical protein n=1 Tax=Natronomonas salina TaxID=1710540 RepID=UPI0015B48199|nr:hypothetical protein [Natronomonas salina]QLD88729.1 hypothetical protein HWV07_06635 [Natronomonas salina]
MTERSRERDEEPRSEREPIETVFGAAFGPFGATVRSVFGANRVAFSLAFGPGVSRPDDDDDETTDGLDGATTIEIEDTGDEGENEAENASGGTNPESASGSESDAGDASE